MNNANVIISCASKIVARVAMLSALILGLNRADVAANDGNGVQIVPSHQRYRGQTYSEWSAAFWQWNLEHPLEGHPGINSPDFDVRSGQEGNVWFLGGPVETVTRSVTIPAGKALFVALLNAEASSLEDPPFHGDTADEQRAAAIAAADHIVGLVCTIDGEPVDNLDEFRVVSPQFSFTAPTPWIFGSTGGTGTSVADGYYLLLKPLPKGEHTLHFAGTFHFTLAEDGFDADLTADMTYIITAR